MRHIIQAVLFWIGTPFLAKTFVVLLAVILVACMYRYLKPLERLSWELRNFTRWSTWASRNDPPTKGPVGTAFKDFHEAWSASQTKLGEVSRGMVPPDDYLSSSRLLSGRGRAIPIALPGVFAGIGILGTFIGIVLGLSGINTGDTNELMGSVQALLGGMSTAFVSSIVGITFSVGWLIGHRALLGHVEAALVEVRREVSRRFPVWDSSAVMSISLVAQQDQLAALSQIVLGQEKEIKTADELKGTLQNLGADIAGALEQALAKEVAPALRQLDESFAGLSSDIRGNQMDGIQELATEFREQLMGSVKEDFDRLADGLQSAANVQEEAATKLSAFLAEVTEVTEGQTELLEATSLASEQFRESIDGLSEVHAGIRESVPVLSGVAETAATLLADVRAQSDILSTANVELREALAEQVDEVQRQVEKLSHFGETFGGSLEDFRAELQESIVEFRNVAAERLGEVFAQFDREMAKVVEHLAGTMAELREVSEELPTRVQGLHSAVEGLGEPVSRMVDAFDAGRSALDGYGEHLKRLDRFLGDAAPLEESLGRLEARAADLVVSLDEFRSRVDAPALEPSSGESLPPVPGAPERSADA